MDERLVKAASDSAAHAVDGFPVPRIPLSPVLSFSRLGWAAPSIPSGIADAAFGLRVTSGRVAIAMALEHAGLNAGDEVLVPAYHCESMVAPVKWMKLRPIFYRLRADAQIDLTDIASRLSERTRVLLVTHYFGFPQDMRSIRNFCDSHGLLLIEDCAHAYYGIREQCAVGSSGDYSVASLVKFFPIFDGGSLTSWRRDLTSLKLRSGSLTFEAKSAINAIERAVGYGRLGLFGYVGRGALRVKDWLWRSLAGSRRNRGSAAVSPGSSEGGYAFEPEWMAVRMSIASKLVIGITDERRLIERRRQRYSQLLEAFRAVPGCRPLFDTLPEGVVPLVFPLYVDRAREIFPMLKQAGVPIWRFGEYLDDEVLESGICPVSLDLSEHLFQLPCHQELTDKEFDWMIATVTRALQG